jgi:hypothetical protein
MVIFLLRIKQFMAIGTEAVLYIARHADREAWLSVPDNS